jgi:hypothetical protein
MIRVLHIVVTDNRWHGSPFRIWDDGCVEPSVRNDPTPGSFAPDVDTESTDLVTREPGSGRYIPARSCSGVTCPRRAASRGRRISIGPPSRRGTGSTSRMGAGAVLVRRVGPTEGAKSGSRKQRLERRDDRLPCRLDLSAGRINFIHGKSDDGSGAALAHLPGDEGLGVLGPRRQKIDSRFGYSAKSTSPRITGV